MTQNRLINDWAREQLHKIFSYVKEHAVNGDVESVIDTVDKYSDEFVASIHIGKHKGIIFDSVVKECQPKFALELGTYFGYTALRTARLLKPGGMVYAVEIDPEVAEVASGLIDFAGMSNRIEVITGKSSDVIAGFHRSEYPVSSFDFVFFDHLKPLYKSDLILLEELKLLKKGTVVFADNIIFHGSPDYPAYVRNSPKYRSTTYPCICSLKNEEHEDAMEKSIFLGQ